MNGKGYADNRRGGKPGSLINILIKSWVIFDILLVDGNGFLAWAGIGLVVLLMVGVVAQFSLNSSKS